MTAAVVIPVYREPDRLEAIALAQCVKVLGRYPLVLLKPASFDAGPLRRAYPQLREEAFDDGFFTGVRGYNRLMLSRALYERFAAHEHILIHQLDAFVFRDELAHWCAQPYDYVGAPWLPAKLFRSHLARARALAKHGLRALLRLDRFDRRDPHRVPLTLRVGNGGFSLRRVAALIRVLDELPERSASALAAEPPLHEDGFFALEANRGRERLRLPDFRVAARFAVEENAQAALAWLTGGQLPFGCHAWDKADPDYWCGVLRGFGYAV